MKLLTFWTVHCQSSCSMIIFTVFFGIERREKQVRMKFGFLAFYANGSVIKPMITFLFFYAKPVFLWNSFLVINFHLEYCRKEPFLMPPSLSPSNEFENRWTAKWFFAATWFEDVNKKFPCFPLKMTCMNWHCTSSTMSQSTFSLFSDSSKKTFYN